MSWWSLTRANLARTPLRTGLTALSLVFAFVLFGLLQPIRTLFNEGLELDGDRRLVVTPKHSVADLLPVKHGDRIAQIEQVRDVAHMTWFGGVYRDAQNFFPQFAVTPAAFLRVNTELQLNPAQAKAFINTRRGAIVGIATAERFGWQVGDTIALLPTIWHNADGLAWSFELVGVFTSSNESIVGNDGFYFDFDYFDEYRVAAQGTVGSFVLAVHDINQMTSTATRIDTEFANSSAETRTQSGAEYALSFARQLGDVGAMATLIMAAVLFTLLVLVGHSMVRSVHERTAEIAVLRVLGFRSSVLAGALLTEFLLLALSAAGIGLGLAHVLAVQLEQGMPQLRQLGGLSLGAETVAQGLALAACITLGLTLLPIFRSVRRPIVPALRAEG